MTARSRASLALLGALLLACADESERAEPRSRAPAAAPDAPAAHAPEAAAPALPERGRAQLAFAEGRVTVRAFDAPRRPLLEQLAREASFELELADGPLAPLTLEIEQQPLEAALPLLVGDLQYETVWSSADGAHRLTLLRVGPAGEHDDRADAGASGLRPGEVGDSVQRLLAEQSEAGSEPLSADELARALASPDAELRARAVLSLESEGRDLELLRSLIESDPDPRVRAAATVGLEDAGDFASLEALLGALDDPNPEVVVEVLDSLEFAGDESIVPRLTPLLHHPDPTVRQAAADAIDLLAD